MLEFRLPAMSYCYVNNCRDLLLVLSSYGEGCCSCMPIFTFWSLPSVDLPARFVRMNTMRLSKGAALFSALLRPSF